MHPGLAEITASFNEPPPQRFTVPENEIDDIRVAATYVAGRRVMESGNLAN